MSDDGPGAEALFDPPIDGALVSAYREFLRQAAPRSARDPYYSEETVRFALRDGDVLATAGDVKVAAAACGARLVSERAGASVETCDISAPEARTIVHAIDGERTASDVRAVSAASSEAWTTFVARAFGVVVFAPLAVAELEARVPVAEIVRQPGSPYEVDRAYWENMAAVRARLEETDLPAVDAPRFIALLHDLHALSLFGADGRSFYCPASPIVAKTDVAPGALLREAPVIRDAPGEVQFVSGPRVNATPIGGAHFNALLAERVSDPGSLEPSRSLADDDLSWGGVVTARADSDAAAAPWFCPPRPLTVRHFDSIHRRLQQAHAACETGAREDVLASLASLHWAFVRLHPFAYANQCVAMSLVNHVLRRSHGAGIPHLVLDHWALRLTREAYERAFRRVAVAWLVQDDSPVRRLMELRARKHRAFELLHAIDAAPSLADARRLISARAGDAALVCL